MIIIAALLGLLSLACLMPIIIAIFDCYWWMMTEHTITSYAYDANRFLGLTIFTVIGSIIFLLMLDVITKIDTGENNGNNKTDHDIETHND